MIPFPEWSQHSLRQPGSASIHKFDALESAIAAEGLPSPSYLYPHDYRCEASWRAKLLAHRSPEPAPQHYLQGLVPANDAGSTGATVKVLGQIMARPKRNRAAAEASRSKDSKKRAMAHWAIPSSTSIANQPTSISLSDGSALNAAVHTSTLKPAGARRTRNCYVCKNEDRMSPENLET